MRICVGIMLLVMPACTRPASSPCCLPMSFCSVAEPISFPLADFTLTERSGKKISKADLEGHVWIASFVFTRCTGPCPQVTATMARLQAELADQPDVKLVTFTVDPNRDDPEELRKYATHFRADPDRWLFLTGSEEEIHQLLRKSFKIGVTRNDHGKPGDEFDHSTRLVVVDQEGEVRGYFSGMGDAPVLDADLKKLKELVAALRAP